MFGLYQIHQENEPYIADFLIESVEEKGWLGKKIIGFCYNIVFDLSSEEYHIEVKKCVADKEEYLLTKEFLENCISEHFMNFKEVYYTVQQDDPFISIS